MPASDWRIPSSTRCCSGAGAGDRAGPPVPDPNFAHTLVPSACTPEAGNAYEAAQYQQEGWDGTKGDGRYPGACQRLHFAVGPLSIRPGQNDVLLHPITIEK